MGGAAGEWGEALGGETGRNGLDGQVAPGGREGFDGVDGHGGGGDEDDGSDCGILRGGVAGEEAAHAVADEDEVGGIGAEAAGVGGIAEVGEGGLGVLDGVGEGEVAG